MPVVIAGAIASSLLGGAAATSIIGGVTFGGLLTTAISTGLSFALSSLLTPDQKKTTRSEQVRARDPNPARLVACGRVQLGGSTFVLESIGGAILTQGYVHCRGPIGGFEYWKLDETFAAITEQVDGSGAGAAGVAPWAAAVLVRSHVGTADQAADVSLLSYVPGWTADHQLKGLAYSTQVNIVPAKPEKNFQKVFPNGSPGLRVIMRGRLVYDPGPSGRVWTDNAGLQIRETLTDTITDGVSGRTWRYVPTSRIDDASFTAFSALCSGPVDLKDGSTEPRYSLNGTYDMREPPLDVLPRMLATCDGELYQTPSGKVGIRGGQFVEPTVELTDADFIAFEYQQGNDLLSAYNQLKFNWTDPKNDYQTIPGQAWDDEENQEARSTVLTESTDFTMVHSHPQARRLAKRKTHKDNPRHRLSNCVLRARGLLLVGEATVRIKLDVIGLDTTFRVTRFKPSDGVNLFVTYEADFASLTAEVDDWDPETEEGKPPGAPEVAGAAPSTPLVHELDLSLVRVRLNESAYAVRIRATVDPPESMQGDVDVSGAWKAVGEYRVASPAGPWLPMTEESEVTVRSDLVDDGQTYDVRVAFDGTGIRSPWSDIEQITVVADQAETDAPTGFTATDGGGGVVILGWTNPNDANFSSTIFFYGTTNVLGSASEGPTFSGSPLQTIANYPQTVGSGTKYLWLRTRNKSGVLSSTHAGPIAVSVS